jgi:subtilisin family serine protease
LHSKYLPLALDRTPVKVVAVLAGDSVAEVQAAAGRRLTRAEKLAVKNQRMAEQSSQRGALEAAGGRVIGSFQNALNGIKLTIPRNQIADLRQVPGVIDVVPVGIHKRLNVVSVPRIQAPIAWSGAAGVHGEGVKVAIIDTGIDYTHANFGGPGTVAAFDAAFANDAAPADPALFGPSAPKVKGGTDLVGDDYDADPKSATYQPVPHPDPNPLDCNGHGSHVAGTAAGYGVLASGSTFQGKYDQLTYLNNQFAIGPGVAPLANLYAVRVFGCSGSTDVVADALEWAVENDMDVVNMSLGSDFGSGVDADSLATDAAVKAGVVVVAAAGNGGDITYIAGSPGNSVKAISVAASAREAFERTINLALPAVSGGPAAQTVVGLNSNGADFPAGESLSVVVLKTASGGVSLGCDPQEYVNAGVAGKLVVTQRGTCARVARAVYGQKAGAAAVLMINSGSDLPPFEGPITENPDTGEQYTVTIPFIGVKGPVAAGTDGLAVALREGLPTTLTEGTPIQTGMATFSSTGPRTPDSRLKPDITAPGEAIISTLSGSGNGSVSESGTSMATPHIAGTAALAVQAHPKWRPSQIKSAIINSGDPAPLADYETRRSGSGFVNAAAVAGTQAIAFADADETTLNFKFKEISSDFHDSGTVHVRNDGQTPVSFTVSVEQKSGSPHSVNLSASHITVPPRGSSSIDVRLAVPAATAGNSDDFRDVAGLIKFTPTTASSNRGYTLRVPYYLVPRVTANVDAKLVLKHKATQGVVALTNMASPIPATADFYAWGLEDKNERLGSFDLHAAGVQSAVIGTDTALVFAINTYKGWQTPETREFDVLIDSDGDGKPDYDVFSADFGAVAAGANNGEIVAFILNIKTGDLSADFDAVAPLNASTILLPVLASSVGVTTTNPRFEYTVQSFDLTSTDSDSFDNVAAFNAFQSAVSTGILATVKPNTAVGVTVNVNRTEFAKTPPLGLMVVSPDNKNGAREVNLLNIRN